MLADVDYDTALLDPAERQRHQRFRFQRHRDLFATAHALLRTRLSAYAPVAPERWRFREVARGLRVPFAPPGSASVCHMRPVVRAHIQAFHHGRKGEHYTLGGERFAQTYGLPAAFQAESALVTHDRPLLDATHREKLAAWTRSQLADCDVEDLSDAAAVPADEAGEPVLTLEELSRQLNVSTKTISLRGERTASSCWC